MTFHSIEEVQNLYREYAGGQQKKRNEEIVAKYFYCSRKAIGRRRHNWMINLTKEEAT
jgi:hypothetical protein